MNRKITGILSVLALSAFTFAQAPATPAAAPAAEPAAPAEAAPAPEATPAASAPAASTENAVASNTGDVATDSAVPEESAPVAVRGADAAESPAVETAAPAEPVEEPSVMVAPKAVRGAGYSSLGAERPRNTTNTVYYETVYTNEDGVPVRTVYVAQREAKDTVTMEKLMGLIPMDFKIGVHGSIGSYYLSSNDWDGDSYDGMNWRAGLMSIIPLSDYTMGIKLGVLYNQSEASESYYINGIPYSFKFQQKKIDVPVMFTFKAPTSRIFFDLGTQISIPVYDKLKYSYTNEGKKTNSKIDMMDENFRNSVDWSFLFGFSVLAHKYISLDVGADIGVSNLYDGHIKYLNLDLSASSFNIGLTVYPF